MKKRTSDKQSPRPDSTSVNAGGILSGLAGLLDKLNDLAETGAELRQSSEVRGAGGKVQGIYGFTVKVGLGDQAARVESFGNIRADKKTGQPVVEEIREPVVDVFEEKDHLLIVAEMPGISAGDVKLEIKDDVLTITANRGDKKYRKEVLLPCAYARDKMDLSCHNGVLEIRCRR
jgi:HSP20 family protein